MLPRTKRDAYNNAKSRRRTLFKTLQLYSHKLPTQSCGPGPLLGLLLVFGFLYLSLQRHQPAGAHKPLSPPGLGSSRYVTGGVRFLEAHAEGQQKVPDGAAGKEGTHDTSGGTASNGGPGRSHGEGSEAVELRKAGALGGSSLGSSLPLGEKKPKPKLGEHAATVQAVKHVVDLRLAESEEEASEGERIRALNDVLEDGAGGQEDASMVDVNSQDILGGEGGGESAGVDRERMEYEKRNEHARARSASSGGGGDDLTASGKKRPGEDLGHVGRGAERVELDSGEGGGSSLARQAEAGGRDPDGDRDSWREGFIRSKGPGKVEYGDAGAHAHAQEEEEEGEGDGKEAGRHKRVVREEQRDEKKHRASLGEGGRGGGNEARLGSREGRRSKTKKHPLASARSHVEDADEADQRAREEDISGGEPGEGAADEAPGERERVEHSRSGVRYRREGGGAEAGEKEEVSGRKYKRQNAMRRRGGEHLTDGDGKLNDWDGLQNKHITERGKAKERDFGRADDDGGGDGGSRDGGERGRRKHAADRDEDRREADREESGRTKEEARSRGGARGQVKRDRDEEDKEEEESGEGEGAGKMRQAVRKVERGEHDEASTGREGRGERQERREPGAGEEDSQSEPTTRRRNKRLVESEEKLEAREASRRGGLKRAEEKEGAEEEEDEADAGHGKSRHRRRSPDSLAADEDVAAKKVRRGGTSLDEEDEAKASRGYRRPGEAAVKGEGRAKEGKEEQGGAGGAGGGEAEAEREPEQEEEEEEEKEGGESSFVTHGMDIPWGEDLDEKEREEKLRRGWAGGNASAAAAALPDSVWAERQGKVRDAFLHAWRGYRAHAFGRDELRPVSRTGVDGLGGLGATIVDGLDTAIIMGLRDVVREAGLWIEAEFLARLKADSNVNLFETTIRVVGGLLSAYHLLGGEGRAGAGAGAGAAHDWRGAGAGAGGVSAKPGLGPAGQGSGHRVYTGPEWGPEPEVYLDRAQALADKLMVAFEASPSAIPFSDVVLGSREARLGAPSGECSTSEATTLGLEYLYLSNLTGDARYGVNAMRTLCLVQRQPMLEGLVPIYISSTTGEFMSNNIRLGSRGDSYYEYLLKIWLQLGRGPAFLRAMYDAALRGVRHYLLKESKPRGLLFIAELPNGKQGATQPKMDHLVCFMGGTIALGATGGLTKTQMQARGLLTKRVRDDLLLAEDFTHTCYQMYAVTATGLAPEIAYFSVVDEGSSRRSAGTVEGAEYAKDIEIKPLDRHNLLRPETVESLLYLYRITGNSIYREWGWRIFESFEKYARVASGGYSSLQDVTVVPPPLRDRMETFFLGETLKYLYLLFGSPDVLPLDKYVFNTEAHPFPILGRADGLSGISKEEHPLEKGSQYRDL